MDDIEHVARSISRMNFPQIEGEKCVDGWDESADKQAGYLDEAKAIMISEDGPGRLQQALDEEEYEAGWQSDWPTVHPHYANGSSVAIIPDVIPPQRCKDWWARKEAREEAGVPHPY